MMPALLRVMYAPLDYVHPAHFSTAIGTIPKAVQPAVNHSLIQRFELNTVLDFRLQSSDFSHLLVLEWNRIADVAWLLGCKMGRGSLAMNGYLATLPNVARRFVELPLACPPVAMSGPATPDNIRSHGARYLFLLKPHLPIALAQRLNLLFAPGIVIPDPAPDLNRSLITFAFDYAKNIKH